MRTFHIGMVALAASCFACSSNHSTQTPEEIDGSVNNPVDSSTGDGSDVVSNGDTIYPKVENGFFNNHIIWHGDPHASDGLRAQIMDWPRTLVNHETTWTNVVYKDDPRKNTDKPWMSLKDGTHNHSVSSNVLYELSFRYDGGYKDFRTEQGNKQYRACNGGTTFDPPINFLNSDGSFKSGESYSFKFVRFNKPDGSAVVSQYWVIEPGQTAWRKVGELIDHGSGLCGVPPIGLPPPIPGDDADAESVLRANGGDYTVDKVEMYEIQAPADGTPK